MKWSGKADGLLVVLARVVSGFGGLPDEIQGAITIKGLLTDHLPNKRLSQRYFALRSGDVNDSNYANNSITRLVK